MRQSPEGGSFSPWHLDAILAHELAHIRRHDYLSNLIQSVIETLLFYHPAVWWVGSRLRADREHCCDDLAVSLFPNRKHYAEALLTVAEASPSPLVLAAGDGDLGGRIRRLLVLPHRRGCRRAPGSGIVIFCLAVAIGLALALNAYTQAEQDVADVKDVQLDADESADASTLVDEGNMNRLAEPNSAEDIELLARRKEALRKELERLTKKRMEIVAASGHDAEDQEIIRRISPLVNELIDVTSTLTAWEERQARDAETDVAKIPAFKQRVIDIPYRMLLDGDMKYNIVIRPGDVIRIPDASAGFVYVMGEVSRPGAYTVPAEGGLTLKQLIASAGGQNHPYVSLVRRVGETKEAITEYKVSWLFDGLVEDPYLAPNDLLNAVDTAPESVAKLEKIDYKISALGTAVEQIDTLDPQKASERSRSELTKALRAERAQLQEKLAEQLPKPPPMPPDPAADIEISQVTAEDLIPDMREYVIGPKDLITVSVFELIQPDMESINTRRVDETGQLRLPVIGSVRAAGVSASQLETEIKKVLKDNGTLPDAQVSVVMQESKRNTYSVIGEPSEGGTQFGTYIIPKPDHRLLDALALARGVPGRTKTIRIFRQEPSRPAMSGTVPGGSTKTGK